MGYINSLFQKNMLIGRIAKLIATKRQVSKAGTSQMGGDLDMNKHHVRGVQADDKTSAVSIDYLEKHWVSRLKKESKVYFDLFKLSRFAAEVIPDAGMWTAGACFECQNGKGSWQIYPWKDFSF